MDYWALGHIHRHHVVSAARPAAVYCGNPQGRDPGEADPRGCYLVTVDDAGNVKLEFRPVDVVRWQLLDVPVGDLETEEGLVDAVTTAVDEARAAADRSIVARVRLTGRGPLHASLDRRGVRDDLRAEAQDRLGLAEPFGWIESVRDATRLAVDLETRRQADDFVGDLLRRLDATRRVLTGGEPLENGTVDGVPIAADIDRVVDDLPRRLQPQRDRTRHPRPGERAAGGRRALTARWLIAGCGEVVRGQSAARARVMTSSTVRATKYSAGASPTRSASKCRRPHVIFASSVPRRSWVHMPALVSTTK